MRFLTKKRMIWAVISLLALFVVLKSCSKTEPQQYMTAVVSKGNVEAAILATGILKPYKLVAVGARTTGRVTALNVRPGDVVKEGDILAQIDPLNQQNSLKRATAALAVNQARLAQENANLLLAQKKLDRVQRLLASRSISQEEFDQVKTQAQIQAAVVKSLEAQIQQSEVDISIAQNDLSYTKISAPISGTVLATLVQEGQTINAVQSAPTVVIIGDLSKMRVYGQISEADILRTHVGQKVYFTVLGNPDRRYEAVLENIEPAPESIRTDISFNGGAVSSLASGAIYYNATFIIDNADQSLHTYMTAEAHIILGEAKDVITVPADALENVKGNEAEVTVLKGKHQEKRKIQIGVNDKFLVEVKSGLKVGETVIIGADLQKVVIDKTPDL